MDTQAEFQRENDAFEAGVQAYFAYIDADTDEEVNSSHRIWREWAKAHEKMAWDAQTEARRRWSAK